MSVGAASGVYELDYALNRSISQDLLIISILEFLAYFRFNTHGQGMSDRYFETVEVADNYSAFRTSYPPELFRTIIGYLKLKLESHGDKFPLALDVGCGTGEQSTYHLSEYFDKVIGSDVSPAMIGHANKANHARNVEFKVSAAEVLPVEDGKVSLVTVATALHWFDCEKFYSEVDRVLVPGGVVAAFCIYGPFTVINHQNCENATVTLRQIWEKLYDEKYVKPGNILARNGYTDEKLQIPYSERTRVDDFEITIDTSVEKLFARLKTSSLTRRILEMDGESGQAWWQESINKWVNRHVMV